MSDRRYANQEIWQRVMRMKVIGIDKRQVVIDADALKTHPGDLSLWYVDVNEEGLWCHPASNPGMWLTAAEMMYAVAAVYRPEKLSVITGGRV